MEKLQRTAAHREMRKIHTGEKINAKTVLGAIITAVISALLGQGSLFGELHPFGFAMIIACPGVYSFSSFIGTSIGLVFSQTGIYLFRYLVCACALWIIRSRLLTPHSRLGDVWFASFAACFGVCAFTGIAVALPTGGFADDILMFIAEALIASFSSFFYKRCIVKFTKNESIIFSSKEIVCLYISFATIIASVADIKISAFSPAEFLSFFAVIFSAYVLSETGGALSACVCAAALSTSIYDEYNIFPLIFAGIVCAVFSPLGKIASALSFLSAFAATTFFASGNLPSVQILSAAIAALVFLSVPNKTYRKITAFFRTKESSALESTYRKDVSQKLSDSAKTVSTICTGMNKVSRNLKRIDNNYDRNIFCRVQKEICSDCENHEKCWQHSFQYTLKGFEELAKNYRKSHSLSDTSFSRVFLSKCVKKSDLVSSLIENFKRYDESLREEICLDEKRKLISDQMQCMSDILNEFSLSFSKCSLVDNELSQKIKEIFNSFSVRCTKAVCIINTDGNMTIKAFCKKIDSEVDRKKLKSQIEQTALRKFSNAEIDFTENGTVVIYRQKPWMKLRTGKIQLASDESPICGDCLREFDDEYGNRTVILSDGMGTGGRAAVDAAMTAEYFSDLLEGHISPDNALRIINSVLSVKSTNESLATIDAAKFNLFSGKVEFFKAGAAVSFVRKNGKCFVIEGASLPAGILHDISFAKEKVTLSKGDIAVMVSDGVTNNSIEWIIEEIERFNHSNPEILAQKIASAVCEKNRAERRDDITVFAGILL